MSDHMPTHDGRWSHVRMELDQMPDYIEAIRHAQRTFPEARIRAGLECEYLPEERSFYEDRFFGRYQLDYLVLGMHYYQVGDLWADGFSSLTDTEALRLFTNHCIFAMESGLFSFVAHADILGCSYAGKEWDKNAQAASQDLIQAAVDLHIPLEINGYGIRKPWIDSPEGLRPQYPWRPFWELAAELGATVICNSDAHDPNDVLANHSELSEITRNLGFTSIFKAHELERKGAWMSGSMG